MASNRTLMFTGFVLCLIGAIVATLVGIFDIVNGLGALPSLSLGLAYGIIYFALGLLSIIFSLRVNRRYDSTAVILLLVFSIIILILGGLGLNLVAVAAILILLGAILLLVGKA